MSPCWGGGSLFDDINIVRSDVSGKKYTRQKKIAKYSSWGKHINVKLDSVVYRHILLKSPYISSFSKSVV